MPASSRESREGGQDKMIKLPGDSLKSFLMLEQISWEREGCRCSHVSALELFLCTTPGHISSRAFAEELLNHRSFLSTISYQ